MDSSALVAVLLEEEDSDRLLSAMQAAPLRRIAAPNWLESSLVFDGRTTPASFARLDAAVAALAITIVPFDADLARIARDANLRYGRVSGHPAKLNYGDCMAYALAKATGEPLLFKGNDFIHTDITPALS